MRNNTKSFFVGNIVKLLTANLLVAIMGFVNSFIFPKIMTLENYAIYHSFTLYVTYIAIFHLGFPDGLMIKYAGKKYLEIDKSDYKAETYLMLFVLVVFTAIFLITYILTDDMMVLFICLAIIPINYLGSMKALWQSWALFSKYSIVNSILAIFIPATALIYYLLKKDLSGNVYICLYLTINWGVTVFIIKRELKFTKKVKSSPIFSKTNYEIEKIGFGFLIGNYINTLFTSCDKQFVKWFFTEKEFAFYSFGMSMQALMSVFITSMSQPLFPLMANSNIRNTEQNKIKNCLLVFGSFSGCAYFFASFVVKNFIIKFEPSLEVVRIYFLVFPALAVVNCLYVNLYKINNRMKEYLKTLIFVLVLAVMFNAIFIFFLKSYLSVAIATILIYYIWLCIGAIQFKYIRFNAKDILFILLFFIGFMLITSTFNDIFGCIIYFIIFLLLAFLFYTEEMRFLIRSLVSRFAK